MLLRPGAGDTPVRGDEGTTRVAGPDMAATRVAAPRAVLLGNDGPTCDLLRTLLADAGYDVREERVDDRTMTMVTHDDAIALLIVVGGPQEDVATTLSLLHRQGCVAPTVVLARALRTDVRQRAFALGAIDVVSLPTDTHHLRVRLSIVRQSLRPCPAGGTASGSRSM